MSKREEEEGIDYRAEGLDPGEEKKSPTDEGYDEAAHSGSSRYGVASGAGGVFGTSGGGTYPGGIEVQEEIEDREQDRSREQDETDGRGRE